MALIYLTFAILLVNRVKASQINITTLDTPAVNTLPDASTEAVFAFQIRQIRTTSEARPAASGNNLNVGGASDSLRQDEQFPAISTRHPFQSGPESNFNKKYGNESNVKSISPFFNKTKDMDEIYREKNYDKNKPSPLVWDGCSETNVKEDNNKLPKVQSDMEVSKSDIRLGEDKTIRGIGFKRQTNDSETLRAWKEKYYNLMNNIQQKHDNVPRKVAQFTSTTIPTSTVKIVPITRQIFEISTDSVNLSQDIVTENNSRAGYTEDWFEPKDRTKIRFSGLPQTENYLIPTLKLEKGFHPFGFMSQFFSLIYPFEFPAGLIKDIMWGKFTFPYSFVQSIKIESTFLGFIILFACIAMVIPAYLLILSILALLSKSRCDDELETGALFPDTEESHFNDRLLAIFTLFLLLIACLFIFGMVISNEQAHAAVVDTRSVISWACGDIATWLATAAHQLHHSIIPPVDLVLHAYREDLNNVDHLLGEPIQQAISSESGIELVLDSLADITTESEDISSKVSSLRDLSIRGGALLALASDRIKDLARQIDNLKRHCNVKDAPLCDTINTHSLELQLQFDQILQEKQLLTLRSLGVENMTLAISTARQDFRNLPMAISSQTTKIRADILKHIEVRRQIVHSSSRILNDIVRHVTTTLQKAVRYMDSGLERFQTYEFWRWIAMLSCLVLIGFVTILILMGMLCGCGRGKDHGKRTLQVSAIWLCLTSITLWILIALTFLVAGHAEIFVCHALWDSPQYKTLSALLDRPSPLLTNDEGAFDALFRDLENVTIDVPITDVLRECEQDRPAYVVFQLDKVLDVDKETSYFEWVDLQRDLMKLTSSIDVKFLKTVSVYFNELLNQILAISDVNLAKYRMNYNGPIVGKDLPSLVDQLENIAAQVSDLTTAGRLETLASRTQRLHLTTIKPLEQLRADVVFKLTELELQLMPYRKKLNISLSHIHTAQFYIDNQGEVIAQKKATVYVSRLMSHTAGWRTHVLTSTGKHAARCRPLFEIYSAVRALLCSNYVSSLHGWWVCGFLLGIVWCTALLPTLVKLWRAYDRRITAHEAMTLANLGQQGTPTTAMCDESANWNAPGPPPPRSDSW